MVKRGLVCADTSFLFSIYNNNEHTTKALRLLRRLSRPIAVSIINEYEIGSALRFSEFLSEIGEGLAEVYLAQFEADLLTGRLVLHESNLNAVFARAKTLAAKYVIPMGARSFDMLHVANALVLGAEVFLTFDRLQQKLALAEGLESPW